MTADQKGFLDFFGEADSKYLDSQVAGNNRALYPKVEHYWFKVAHNFEPLALQVNPKPPNSKESVTPVETISSAPY